MGSHFFQNIPLGTGSGNISTTQQNQKHHLFAFSVRPKKRNHFIVVESQARSSESLCIGPKVELSSQNSRFKLRCPVSPVTKSTQNFSKIQMF